MSTPKGDSLPKGFIKQLGLKKMTDLEKEITHYLKCGVYCPHEIFNRIYPTYMGHYSTLRNTISRIKEKGVN